MSKEEAIKNLNEEINKLHNSHYENRPTGLIDEKDAPNSNTIYHLYNDGEVTYQKGSWAYLRRSEFTESGPIYMDTANSPYVFPKVRDRQVSYAVLTREECMRMKKKMAEVKEMS